MKKRKLLNMDNKDTNKKRILSKIVKKDINKKLETNLFISQRRKNAFINTESKNSVFKDS